jgi:molybdopterin-containing oxidoreductase family iron-sulfur binding subunit
MQACPTDSIIFGNVNDKASEVYKIRNVEQTHRAFYVMEQLHVLPNVNYLVKVKNTDRAIGATEEGHEEMKTEKAHA